MIPHAFKNNNINIINVLIKYVGHIQTFLKLLKIKDQALSLKAIELLIKNTVLFSE